jgi:mono/diheme cytochrome c family protein
MLLLMMLATSVKLPADEISYLRDVRPILAANCFSCHGVDEKHREAGLRLDTAEGATGVREGHAAIIAGNPEQSQLIERITSKDAERVMPPKDSGKTLTPAQIKVLRNWIESGARYEQHWAFVPPIRPVIPAFSSDRDREWIHNPIDAFVLERLRKEELEPSERASLDTLLRRVSLDLTGLPPTIEEQNAVAFDSSSEAWNRQVERLLASPHFGEKWARHWLDAARYADSDGFEKDKPRFVWFYRDWVVKAFNEDMPYDQFLIEQLAGDLLPGATQDQLVATGFLRNSMINEEGGVDPEQFRMEAMFDRIDAIGKSMLGLTIQCCQCHDHKYDPISQSEYYQMFAFLNNCDEAQATVYTPESLEKRAMLLRAIAEAEAAIKRDHPDWSESMKQWEEELRLQDSPWTVVRPELDSSGGQKHYLQPDGSVLAQGYAPTKHTTVFDCTTDLKTLTGFRLELLLDSNLPHGGPGRAIDGQCAVTEFQVDVTPLGASAKPVSVKFASATADISATDERELAKIFDDKSGKRRTTGSIEKAIDGDNLTAWGIHNGPGRSNVPRNAVFVPAESPHSESGFRVTFKLVQMHGGWNSDDNQNNNPGRFRFSVTDQPAPKADLVPPQVRSIVAKPPELRTAEEQAAAFSFWQTIVPEYAAANAAIEGLWKQHPEGHTQLVLHERLERRRTWRLTRGDFLQPAEEVNPGVPGMLHRLPDSNDPDRLRFARWVADRRSPTTARAIVNRLWLEYFGTGLVQTAEDFGTQSEYPSHPALLDWLAVELMDNNWSLKHIHRLIVNSSTYQQSSHISLELHERDPGNRLLARGPRFRVNGEVVRDIALSVSGLLNPMTGGPPVYPPAPDFLFQPPASYGPKTWTTETGPDRYRRALYTFRFRSVPYPMLENFDTPRGDTACVRRSRSNTPLQALTTLNEDLFVECSRALALNVVATAEHDDQTRLRTAFRRCTSRWPSDEELDTLFGFLKRQKERFASETQETAWLLAAAENGDKPQLPSGVTAGDLAAWTALSRVILNLDEIVTKE